MKEFFTYDVMLGTLVLVYTLHHYADRITESSKSGTKVFV